MNTAALALVLTSALIHATWNLLAKKSGGGNLFVWAFTSLSSLFLVPTAIALIVIQQHEIDFMKVVFIVGTTLIHLAYFTFLQLGYKAGDLSLVYPLARGLGPALSTLGAIIFLQERPSSLAISGLVLIITGIAVLTVRLASKNDSSLDSEKEKQNKYPRAAIFYGVTTGALISIYTVWDKYAVHRLEVPPLVLEAFAGLGISLMLTPSAFRRWNEVKDLWKQHKTEVIGVAILAPLSYILVLTAMSFTPLSYVAPCREVSIFFAAILASVFLGEGNTAQRIVAACLMVGGVITLAIG